MFRFSVGSEQPVGWRSEPHPEPVLCVSCRGRGQPHHHGAAPGARAHPAAQYRVLGPVQRRGVPGHRNTHQLWNHRPWLGAGGPAGRGRSCWGQRPRGPAHHDVPDAGQQCCGDLPSGRWSEQRQQRPVWAHRHHRRIRPQSLARLGGANVTPAAGGPVWRNRGQLRHFQTAVWRHFPAPQRQLFRPWHAPAEVPHSGRDAGRGGRSRRRRRFKEGGDGGRGAHRWGHSGAWWEEPGGDTAHVRHCYPNLKEG